MAGLECGLEYEHAFAEFYVCLFVSTKFGEAFAIVIAEDRGGQLVGRPIGGCKSDNFFVERCRFFEFALLGQEHG